ncbi:unnamed protein product [Rotaria magnacalcarata]|uniref:F-box domain-containing protein n=2 Tax=Rotaria magnacalcarata TaxID=392030 RepID=A0A816GK90_9BILA|nr:unnamed protein product [Rotaria magnacalcarata]
MSNELILYVWDQLTAADAIYSFSDLNTRINSLLLQFCELYKQLDLRYCSLSACRFLCHQASTMIEWRLGLTVIKLGNRYRCSQMDMFADEVAKSIVGSHFARQGKSCNNAPKNIFRVLVTYNKQIQPIFPQLASLVVFQFISINEDSRDTLLFAIAGGSSMRTFTWNTCSNQTHHSRALFDWLFRCSVNLVSYKLQTPPLENGFELKYEYTIANAYVPHRSLVYLQISILNLNTLYILLHYLPQLKHLDVYISSIIDSINTTDQYLASKLNYPETLRVLNLRNLRIRGSDCSCLEQLMGKFTNTVEEFSLCLTHYCTDEVDVCFNGHRLATLCSRLPRLRSLHFAIHLQFIERRRTQTLTDFAQTFRTPFWLDGPLGRIQVCMTYDQVFNFVQMLSLPYTFSDNILFYTIDLIDVLFNNSEEEKERPNNLSIALRPL